MSHFCPDTAARRRLCATASQRWPRLLWPSAPAIRGGTAGNFIPEAVALRATIRTLDKNVRTKLYDGIRRAARASASRSAAPEPEVKITPGVDSVVNDASVVDRTEAILKRAFEPAKVKRLPPATPTDDFAEFVSAGVPSMFFFVGVLDPKDVEASRLPGGRALPINHSPDFAPVPEPSIKTGVKAMTLAGARGFAAVICGGLNVCKTGSSQGQVT